MPRKPQGQERERKSRSDDAPPAHLVPPIRSEAARQVAIWFGLPLDGAATRPRATIPPGLDPPAPGHVMLITGPSGAGKSSLLNAIIARAARSRRSDRPVILRADRLRLPELPCVDQFGSDVRVALDLLNRVGLGEACTYLRLPSELSDGQRWRLKLAAAIGLAQRTGRPAILVADEFCAVLDRVSAAVVARALRRTVDRSPVPLAAILATSHDDLEPALLPDTIVRCDFGGIHIRLSRKQ